MSSMGIAASSPCSPIDANVLIGWLVLVFAAYSVRSPPFAVSAEAMSLEMSLAANGFRALSERPKSRRTRSRHHGVDQSSPVGADRSPARDSASTRATRYVRLTLILVPFVSVKH